MLLWWLTLLILKTVGVLLTVLLVWQGYGYATYRIRLRRLKQYTRAPGFWPLVDLFDTDGDAALACAHRWSTALKDDAFVIGPFASDWAPTLLVGTPTAMQRVLTHPEIYRKGSLYETFTEMLGQGLVTSEGAVWFHNRKIMNDLFTLSQLKKCSAIMNRKVQEWVDALPGYDGDVYESCCSLALSVLCGCMFGNHRERPELYTLWNIVTHEFPMYSLATLIFSKWTRYVPWPPILRYLSALAKARAIVKDMVEESRNRKPDPAAAASAADESESDSRDVIDWLLAHRDDAGGRSMDDAQIVDECMTLLVAGHETTSSLLSVVLQRLCEHPELQAVVAAEGDRILGKLERDGRTPSDVDLRELFYTRALLTETLRRTPPVAGLSRVATVDDEIDGRPVPAGTNLLVDLFTANTGPWWGPDAREWKPDRWLDPAAPSFREVYEHLQRTGSMEGFQSIPVGPRGAPAQVGAWNWIPFSGGPRVCIGKNFALSESTLALASLCRRYRFAVRPDCKPRLQVDITIHVTDFKLKIEPRSLEPGARYQ
jgi:cytochrome P450